MGVPPHMHLSAAAIYASTGINLTSYRSLSMCIHARSTKNALARCEYLLRRGQPSLSSHPLFPTHPLGDASGKPGWPRICYRTSLTSPSNAQIAAPLRLTETRSKIRLGQAQNSRCRPQYALLVPQTPFSGELEGVRDTLYAPDGPGCSNYAARPPFSRTG